MKQINNFEYILFKDENGRNFVMIKGVWKKTEVTDDVMRFLRSCEKKIIRENDEFKNLDSEDPKKRAKAEILFPQYYFSEIDEESMESFVLEDWYSFEESFSTQELVGKFIETLSESQKEVFFCVMLGGEKECDFAMRKCITDRAVRRKIEKIQKKAKIFFKRGSCFG